MPAAPEPQPGQLFWTVDQTSRALGLHSMTVRALINRGAIPSVRLGRAIRIPVKALEAQLEEQTSPRPKAARPNGGICAGRRRRVGLQD